MFCKTWYVSSQVAQMYQEEIHFGKLFLKQSETVLIYLTPVSLTFDPVNPKSIGVLCCPGRMYGQDWDQGLFQLLIGNSFGTFDPGDLDLWPSNLKSKGFHLLIRMDVWTKFEEDKSRRSRAIDFVNEKVTDERTCGQGCRQTDRHAGMQTDFCKGGGHKKMSTFLQV